MNFAEVESFAVAVIESSKYLTMDVLRVPLVLLVLVAAVPAAVAVAAAADLGEVPGMNLTEASG